MNNITMPLWLRIAHSKLTRILTGAPHLDPVQELLSAGRPALICSIAYHRLQLLMAHEACEKWQIYPALCCCHMAHLQRTA